MRVGLSIIPRLALRVAFKPKLQAFPSVRAPCAKASKICKTLWREQHRKPTERAERAQRETRATRRERGTERGRGARGTAGPSNGNALKTHLILFYFILAAPTAVDVPGPGIESKLQLRPVPRTVLGWEWNTRCHRENSVGLNPMRHSGNSRTEL